MTEQELRALDAQVAEKVMGYRWLRFARLGEAPLKCLVPPGASDEWAHFKPLQGDEVVADDALRWVRPLSTDIAAAFTVVEKMAEKGYRVGIVAPRGEAGTPADRWSCGFLDEGYWQKDVLDGDLDFYAEADALPEAICLASLQAVEAER